MGERIAVNREQRPHGSEPEPADRLSEPVGRGVGGGVGGHRRQVVEHDRVAENDPNWPGDRAGRAAIPAGTEGRRLERDTRRTPRRRALVSLPQPLLAPRALGEHDDDVPVAAEPNGGLTASRSRSPRRTGKDPGRDEGAERKLRTARTSP